MFKFMYSRHEIDRALKFWTDVANVRITETDGRADIMISFQSGYHGDPYPFDGPGNIYISKSNLKIVEIGNIDNPKTVHLRFLVVFMLLDL